MDTNPPAKKYGLLFPIAAAAGLLTPAAGKIDHAAIQPAAVTPGASLEYGAYLWPLCTECHSSNLAGTLQKNGWTQDDFIRAMQTSILPDGKQIGQAMRKKAFSELSDTELTALWLYMNSLPQQSSGK
ncbi:hypothetical protein FDZ74_14460 [bacterium]|nr:MAG: hypothetical protein FDZ74_14460 [bacterium]